MYRRNWPKRVVGTVPCRSQRWDFGRYLCYRTGEWSLESTFRSLPCLQISPGNPLLATRMRWTSVRALCHQHGSFADTSGYGCPVHDLWRMMEGAGHCGDPVIQCSAVPGSSLRVLTMPSVRARNHSHYGLESSCPQTKPSPLRVPSGESGHFSVHLSLTGAEPLREPSSLVGETLSLAPMGLTFTVVMAKMPSSAELTFDPERKKPSPHWDQTEMKRLLIPITLPGTSGVRNRGRGL